MSASVRTLLLSLGLVSLNGLVSAARADDACAGDRERLCKEARGFRARAACMKEHEGELSEACKAQRAQVKEAVEEVREECRPDADRLCKGIEPGRGRIHACLKSHREELSAGCKQAIANVRELRESIHPGCRPDVEKLCQGIAPGGGRVLACLRSHEAELSPACKAHVDRAEKREGAAR